MISIFIGRNSHVLIFIHLIYTLIFSSDKSTFSALLEMIIYINKYLKFLSSYMLFMISSLK